MSEILNEYTIDQVTAFERAAIANSEKQLKLLTVQIRFAQNASKKDFLNYIGERSQKMRRNKKMSKEEIASTLGLPNGRK